MMKSRQRWIFLAALLALVLGILVSVGRRGIDGKRRPSAESGTPSISRPDFVPRSKDVDAHEKEIASLGLDSPRSARGAGYVWGKALREVYARSIVNESGKRHLDLDLNALQNSLSQFERPVNLEDASGLPLARAEYLASVITTALDLTGDAQERLAELLESYYTSDWESRGLDEVKHNDERARITASARKRVLDLLPDEMQARFNHVFASKDFLFRSMSLASDEITMQVTGGGTAVLRGNVVFTVDPGGAIQCQAEDTFFQAKGETPRPRGEPAR